MHIRKIIVDTVVMIVFSTVAAMVVEVLISGMTLNQSAIARLIATPVNLLTAGIYGMFRDWMLFKMGVREGERFKREVSDTASFIIFQVPLYIGILAVSGADKDQIISACFVVTGFSAFIGGPYGIVLDFARKIFGVRQEETDSAISTETKE